MGSLRGDELGSKSFFQWSLYCVELHLIVSIFGALPFVVKIQQSTLSKWLTPISRVALELLGNCDTCINFTNGAAGSRKKSMGNLFCEY